jgi:hypothetical protein
MFAEISFSAIPRSNCSPESAEVRHRSEAPREDDSWFHGGTGLQVNAVQQSTWKNQNNMTISKAAEQKGRTMNPLIQLNKQLQYLFIALLLACFVIPAMGGDPTPNHKEFRLNKTPADARWRQVPCAGEGVDIRGLLKLKFGMGDFFNTGHLQFGPVGRDLAAGWESGGCPNRGDCLVGFGKTTRRRYTAKKELRLPTLRRAT